MRPLLLPSSYGPCERSPGPFTRDTLRGYGLDATLWPTDVLMDYPVAATLRLLRPDPFTAALKERVLPEDPTSGVLRGAKGVVGSGDGGDIPITFPPGEIGPVSFSRPKSAIASPTLPH